jgi:phosphatidylserine decarboxylase
MYPEELRGIEFLAATGERTSMVVIFLAPIEASGDWHDRRSPFNCTVHAPQSPPSKVASVRNWTHAISSNYPPVAIFLYSRRYPELPNLP